MIVLDVAHNEDGIKQLLEQVEVTDHHELHIITGFVKDKEVEKILLLLPKTAHYYFTQANIPRALDAECLTQKAESYGLKGKKYDNVNAALTDAKAKSAKDDLVIVCGSVFLVGEVNSK
jgi:dihydrofolate synthase/folylpolyglutamate synthase